jgi:hypothetical protein
LKSTSRYQLLDHNYTYRGTRQWSSFPRSIASDDWLGFFITLCGPWSIAVNKVSWLRGCFQSDILMGFENAISDGVDIISVSIGLASAPYWDDAMALGALAASKADILTVASVGNTGPFPYTVVAAFSSRGPNPVTPGLNVLAAAAGPWSDGIHNVTSPISFFITS